MPSFVSVDQFWERMRLVERVCRTPMSPLTVKRLLELRYKNDVEMAEWTRQELTHRIAHRLHNFHNLPFYAAGNPYIQQGYYADYETFQRFLQVPPVQSMTDKLRLIDVCQTERETQGNTVDLISQGVKQIHYVAPDLCLDEFLERLFGCRIGQRLLIDHFIASGPAEDQPTRPRRATGCLEAECQIGLIIQDCVATTRHSCRGTYAVAAPVTGSGDLDSCITLVPDHVSLIITEMMKNALRATVEYYTFGNSVIPAASRRIVVDDMDLPDVRVSVQKGKNAVAIHISDKGGGMSAHQASHLYQFGYSSVKQSQQALNTLDFDRIVRQDLAGYGFGVPLTRLFSRYFGGDLQIVPCFGVGTDVFITLMDLAQQSSLFFNSPGLPSTAPPCYQTPPEYIPGDVVAHPNQGFLRSHS